MARNGLVLGCPGVVSCEPELAQNGEHAPVPLSCQSLLKLRSQPYSAWCAVLCALTVWPVPSVANASDELRVISLDVSQAPDVKMPAPLAYEKPSWRTSFGSERQSQPVPASAVPGLDADIVLLQGVTSVKVLNRVFPGRGWRIVVSRQMVLTDDPVDPRSYEAVSSAPSTAVVIRYQAGLRVAGQDHFLRGPPQNSSPQTDAPGVRPAAGTAVRLNIGGRFLWVVSVAFGDGCASEADRCEQRTELEAWRQQKLAAGEAVITGGLRQSALILANGPAAACGAQAIYVSPARKEAPQWSAHAKLKTGLGCAAAAEAGGAPESASAGKSPPVEPP